MRRALLVLLLASCRQIFGLHELADKKGDAGSATVDSRIDAARDADAGNVDAPVDAGGRLAGVQCGAGSACDPSASQYCCWKPSSHYCLASGPCGTAQAKLNCDDASDCAPGDLCCVTYDASLVVSNSDCINSATPCNSPIGMPIVYFCDPDGTNQCPSGHACNVQSNLMNIPTGYYQCQ